MIATRDFYTLSDAARELRTYRVRVRKLLVRAGIVPVEIGGQFLIDSQQLRVIRRLHRANPPRPGRPPRVPPS
jgi:hypothetical protein